MTTKLKSWGEGTLEAAVLLAVTVVPVFINLYSFRVFERDKQGLFVALAATMALAGLVVLVEEHGAGLVAALRRPLVAAAVALGVVTAAATAVSIAPRVSLLGSYDRAQGLAALVSYLILFGAVATVARRPERRARIVGALIAGTVPVAGFAVLQALGLDALGGRVESAARVFGTLSNPIFLGAYLMLVLPLVLVRVAGAMAERRPVVYAGYAVVALLDVLALLASASRGPLMGLAAGLFVLLLAGGVAAGWRRLAWGALGLAAAGALFLGLLNMPGGAPSPLHGAPVVGRLAEITDTASGSQRARLAIWTSANRLLAAEPGRMALGHGPETLRYAVLPHAEPDVTGRGQADRLVDRAHNVVLDALTMTGLPGALALLAVYGAWLIAAAAAAGLAATRADRRRLAGLLGLGALVGAASWIVAPAYGAALTLLGLVLGLVVYLVLALVRPIAGADDRPVDLLALGLLAAGTAAVVEAAFGIQTVVTQVAFWALAGLVVAVAAGDLAAPAEAAAPVRRRRATRAEEREGDTITLSWSGGGAALGVAAGAMTGLLAHGFLGPGSGRESLVAVVVLAIAGWLGWLLVAADARESLASVVMSGLGTAVAWAVMYAIVLAAADAAALYAFTALFLAVLAIAAGSWLRDPVARAAWWRGPEGMVYPIAAIVAVALVFWLGVRPVWADIAFREAMAGFGVAIQNDNVAVLRTSEQIYEEKVVARAPREPFYPLKWGEMWMMVGSAAVDPESSAQAFGAAQKYVTDAETLEPKMPYHTFNRGHLQLLFAQALPEGQREAVAADAELALAEAFDEIPFDPQVANELAMAKSLRGDIDGALALLDLSLTIDGENADTHQMRGQVLAVAGDLEEAGAAFERSLELRPGRVELYAAMGDLARQRGDMPAAVGYYEQSLQRDPQNPAAWAILFNLGLAYRDTSRTEDALNALSAALQNAPPAEQPRIQEALETLLSGGAPAP